MEGVILDFNEAKGKGVILGKDSGRYSFATEDLKGDSKISNGSKVDFVTDSDSAKDIYEAVAVVDSKFVKDKSLEMGKEALNMGKNAASKAGGFFNGGMVKRVIASWFDGLAQIIAVLMPIIGFFAGGSAAWGGFHIGYAFAGLIGGFFASIIVFGLLFSILEIRDNTRKTTELLLELKDK